MGMRETEMNLNNKTTLGGLSSVFLLQCLATIGAQNDKLIYQS